MSPTIRPVTLHDAGELAALLTANREWLEPWDPARDEVYYTEDGQRQVIGGVLDQGTSLPHVIVEDGRVVGRVNLNNIVRGPFQSCSLGYWVDSGHAGRGLVTKAVALLLRDAFTVHGLHRVEAGTLLHNVRSQRVLERAGFQMFGMAPRYLKIGGEWQDHFLYQLLEENWSTANQSAP
ncbi:MULTISPECIES: GNAT family protein [Actinoplanes]|uniref:GNAT family N-acetyltransferase n=1 Tax=Actinoplanes TaxID=1865 RepID=UPI0005F2A87B|nr:MULTISPECIES: GNAT family protein [Actinoplanes]GLY03692.1 ribosomal-protein-alanine N-acetyltransferase [Actinoplanes sp. NBRC 101535]